MPRVKRGVGHVKHRNNILKRVKGFQGGRKNLIKLAKTAQIKAGAYAFKDRKVKKRLNRGNWNVNVNAGARLNGTSFSKLMGGLRAKKIDLNRKVLAQIATEYPEVFKKLVEAV